MANIQNPNTAFLAQLSDNKSIYFGKYNNTDAPKEQKQCLTVYLDTSDMILAVFDGETLVGKPEKVKVEHDANEKAIPLSNGVLDKEKVTENFRLPVFRSKSFAFFLQKWTNSAGLLMVVNEPFEPVNVKQLMKGLKSKAV